MNANAIMNNAMMMPRKRKVWLSNGVVVHNVRPPMLVPPKAKVNWEAHIVDTESAENVHGYPQLSGSGVYAIDSACVNGRPTVAICDDYLQQLKGKVSEEMYVTAEENVKSEVWTIATVIHSILPVQ